MLIYVESECPIGKQFTSLWTTCFVLIRLIVLEKKIEDLTNIEDGRKVMEKKTNKNCFKNDLRNNSPKMNHETTCYGKIVDSLQ